MATATATVQCLKCRRLSQQDDRATSWDCACGNNYVLRRCSSCGTVSEVNSLRRNGQPWDCMWCHALNTGFTLRKDPAAATVADLAADMARQNLAFVPPVTTEPEPTDPTPVLIVTMNEIPGYRIVEVHGDVFGLVVRARNVFSNMGSQLTTIVGGEATGFTKLLTDSRNQARSRMWREARARGANAIVAMRFDCNEIGQIMSEVVAYGTAVTVEPM